MTERQDRERDRNLQGVFGGDRKKEEGEMESCRHCGGTGRIKLFTSEADCECVGAGSSASSSPFSETIARGFRESKKFVVDGQYGVVDVYVPATPDPAGASAARRMPPAEIRDLLREIPGDGHVEVLVLCTASALRPAFAAAKAAFAGRADPESTPPRSLTFPNGSRLTFGTLATEYFGISPDLLLLCLDDMHMCDRAGIARSYAPSLRFGGSVASVREDSLLLALGSAVLPVPPRGPHEGPGCSSPISGSPLTRQFAAFNIRHSQFLGGEENEDE